MSFPKRHPDTPSPTSLARRPGSNRQTSRCLRNPSLSRRAASSKVAHGGRGGRLTYM
ncbi:hypothetical protein K456DRAFT_47331 [Colletotrichum gloeosporioides 23]|nr:hypothetical protein K456DRAFT_47331 [Colletotrichum gloeosporioides 23]